MLCVGVVAVAVRVVVVGSCRVRAVGVGVAEVGVGEDIPNIDSAADIFFFCGVALPKSSWSLSSSS